MKDGCLCMTGMLLLDIFYIYNRQGVYGDVQLTKNLMRGNVTKPHAVIMWKMTSLR